MKYSEILSRNKVLEKNMEGQPYKIRILSNIIVHQLKEILEYSLRSEGMFASVEMGNYDNILQDSLTQSDCDITIIFWEAANLTDGLEYKADILPESVYIEMMDKTKAEIQMCLSNLKEKSLVIFNLFSSMTFNARRVERNRFDDIVSGLNDFLKATENKNVRFTDLNKILIQTGQDASIDLRNYYSSKALYSVDFFRNYSLHVKHLILPLSGKVNKALIFDCDNTLWSGILGEDGEDGIKMGGTTSKGKPFEAVQSMAAALARQGVLIGLCSKNNAADVEEVLEKHRDQVLKNEFITIKKINWSDKASNLKDMAEVLNIGTDSFVFVDDSEFELGLINKELPAVKTFSVNTKSYLYPSDFNEIVNHFYRLNRTEEDLKKVQMYKDQAKRESSKEAFVDIQDYLNSLEIEIEIFRDETSLIPRMAQLTQKTNQFNLTTKRYSESEIESMLLSKSFRLYALSVKDKYGDSGITGLAIVEVKDETANIDSLLMSCRIIGRNIEYRFLDYILADLKVKQIHAAYFSTKKNAQVADFYEKMSFSPLEKGENFKKYQLEIKDYKHRDDIKYIRVTNGRKD